MLTVLLDFLDPLLHLAPLGFQGLDILRDLQGFVHADVLALLRLLLRPLIVEDLKLLVEELDLLLKVILDLDLLFTDDGVLALKSYLEVLKEVLGLVHVYTNF